MFGFNRQRRYITPGGGVYTLYQDMLKQPHLLIAGATGSGKSVVVNGLIYTILTARTPDRGGLILIDPKRVELVQWARTPHCLMYASEPAHITSALETAVALIEQRYKKMQAAGARKYNGGDIYIVIDELADLMTTQKKVAAPLIQRIAQIGRAAGVHLIACTQCPISAVIPTQIKVNFDARLGLRTRSAQDSKNILGVNGCEKLPRYGQGYYMRPEGIALYNLPMYTDQQINSLIRYWSGSACIYAA